MNTPSPPLDSEEIRLWRPLAIAGTYLFNAIEAELKAAADLTHLDHLMLLALRGARDGRRRMSEIAAIFGVDPSVITYRVKRLEGRGLVRREKCLTDGRVVLAAITAAGEAVMDAVAPIHAAAVRTNFLQYLDAGEAEVVADIFTRLRLVQHHESLGPGRDPVNDGAHATTDGQLAHVDISE